MKFDLQRHLEQMEERAETRHKELKGDLGKVVTVQNDHETRLVVVENTRKTMRWTVGLLVTTAFGVVVDLLRRR